MSNMQLYDLEQWALEEFQSNILEYWWATDDDKVYDLISEVANSRIPIYTTDILEVAQCNLWLVYDTPEYLDCKCSPITMIQSNIYEHLRDKLSEEYNKNKSE